MSVLSFNLLCSVTAYSQRSLSSFGAIADLSLGYRPLGVAVGVLPDTTAEIAVLAQEPQSIRFYLLRENGRFATITSVKCSKPQRAIAAIKGRGDRPLEYMTLASDGFSVSTYKHTTERFAESITPLAVASQQFLVADLNGDGREDVLLFGRNRSGCSTLLAKPDGSFAAGPELFQDISVSDLRVTDLNGDGIADVFLLNWLSNQLSLFYGIGRMVFSEQVNVSLPAEPAHIDISPVTRERTVRIAVSFSDGRSVGVYTGNSLGEFEESATIASPSAPTDIQLIDVNRDGLLDMLVGTTRGMQVALGASRRTFGQPTTFGNFSVVPRWAIADLDGDKRDDLVFLDRSGRRLIALANADENGVVNWPSEYCVGSSPYGLLIHDFNDDGLSDVAVMNSASSSMSLLFGRPGGRFEGQQMAFVSEYPMVARLVSSTGRRTNRVVATHAASDRFSVITIRREVSLSESFSVPTATAPFVIRATQDSATSNLVILVRSKQGGSGGVTLSSFEQTSGDQFLERSIRSNLPDKIIALTADDILGTGRFQLLYATNDKSTRMTNISMAVTDERLNFRLTKPLFAFPDSAASTRTIVTGLINGDAFKDIAVFTGTARSGLVIATNKGDGTFRDSLEWIRGVNPLNEDAFLVRDLNADGNPDLAFVDVTRKAVVVMYGQDRGGLRPPVAICPADGVNSIRVASIQRPNGRDLVLSNTTRGIVSIIVDPFKR